MSDCPSPKLHGAISRLTGLSRLTRLASATAQPRVAAASAATAASLKPIGQLRHPAITPILFLSIQSFLMACLCMNARSFVSVKSWFSDDRGSAAIEFSLVLPTFLILMIGILGVGWAAHSTHNIRFALAEGARALQLKPTLTQSQLQTLVRSKVYGGHDPQTIAVSLTLDPLSAGV